MYRHSFLIGLKIKLTAKFYVLKYTFLFMCSSQQFVCRWELSANRTLGGTDLVSTQRALHHLRPSEHCFLFVYYVVDIRDYGIKSHHHHHYINSF